MLRKHEFFSGFNDIIFRSARGEKKYFFYDLIKDDEMDREYV